MGKDGTKQTAKKTSYKRLNSDPKGGFTLEKGTKGFFITCHRNKERQAQDEIIKVFEEHYEFLNGTTEHEKSGSIEKDLEAEILALKQTKKRLFAPIQTGMDCSLFIRANDSIDTVQFTKSLLLHLSNSKIKKTRYCSRIIPIHEVCFANVENLKALAKKQINEFLNTKDADTYSILPKARHNTKFNRELIIEALNGLVDMKHKVDLTNPKYSIIVEIVNHVCGVSVVEDYHSMKRFNLEELVKEIN
jgi:tRNA acetyltransferase TAN1